MKEVEDVEASHLRISSIFGSSSSDKSFSWFVFELLSVRY